MQLITQARIRNLRAVEEETLDFGHLTALVGANGSGKSNVLRALNLFFNGDLDGSAPEIGRDYQQAVAKEIE